MLLKNHLTGTEGRGGEAGSGTLYVLFEAVQLPEHLTEEDKKQLKTRNDQTIPVMKKSATQQLVDVWD